MRYDNSKYLQKSYYQKPIQRKYNVKNSFIHTSGMIAFRHQILISLIILYAIWEYDDVDLSLAGEDEIISLFSD